jgi:hypothetical protein
MDLNPNPIGSGIDKPLPHTHSAVLLSLVVIYLRIKEVKVLKIKASELYPYCQTHPKSHSIKCPVHLVAVTTCTTLVISTRRMRAKK